MTDLSLITPVYNEAQNLPLLIDAVQNVMASVNRSWEIVFVDDGSTDDSLTALEAIATQDPAHVRVVVLRRNFGQTAAITAGIDQSSGKIIILLDSDMQNDPADIPLLLAKLDEGYDLVSGWRKDRKDNRLTRTIPSNLANGLISQVTGVHLHDYGCTLKAYRREALEGFRLYGEMHRFIPVFAHSVGARIAEIPVRHHPRKFGKTKYGLNRTIKVILDLFTVKFLLDYSHKPMRVFGGTGLILLAVGMIDLLYLFVRRFFGIPAANSPLLLIGVMFVIISFQAILMGLIAELLSRTYHESQSKTIYTVRRTVNLENRS